MKQKQLIVWALAGFLALGACEEKGEFGVVEDTLFELFLIDTLSLEMSTIHIDSLITQGGPQLLLGQYEDPFLGTFNTSSFFTMSLGLNSLIMEDEDIFDSLSLVIYPHYNRYGHGGSQVIDLYQITQDYEPEDDFFYQFDSLLRTRGPIASFTLRDEDDVEDSISIRINSRLGQQIQRQALDRGDALNFEDEFQDFLKGFTFASNDPEANALNSIPFAEGNVVLKFYYSIRDEDGLTNWVYEFPLGVTGQQFNRIRSMDDSSLIGRIAAARELPISETGGLAFAQGGSALVTRIRIPYLDKLTEALENSVINTATLEIIPLKNSYNNDIPLPTELAVHYADKFTNVNEVVLRLDDTNSAAGDLIPDDEFELETRYEIDVRNFITRWMESGGINDESLIVSIPPGTVQSSLERVVIDGSRFKTRLKIFISNFKD